MTREQEKTLDVEIVEDSNAETQELAELNSYKNELIAKSREIDKETVINTASILEIVGMLKAHKISEQFNKTLRTIKLREIKELKEYKGLTLFDINGQAVTVNSWEEFCKALGTSSKSVDRDVQNLNTFGQEFMQLSESIGLSYRELRRMRQNMLNPMLSEQEKLALEEAKGKDPQEMLTLLEELQDKQASLEEEVKGLKDDIAAKDKVSSDKSKKIEKLELDLAKMSGKSPESAKQAEKNILFNTLENEFAKSISLLQNAKVAFLEVLRLQENGELDEQENDRFDESVLQFLTNVMRFSSEVRSGKYNFLNAADNLGLLPLFSLYIEQNTPKFESPDFENPDNE